MKKFMVYVVVDGSDKYMGTVSVKNANNAYSMIPENIRNMGKVVLVPVIIEA